MTEQAPGWQAIDAALASTYPDTEPRHFAPLVRYRLGGRDPLDGISAYPRTDPVPHWHFVSYGLSELYAKESDDVDRSGWGFELTFRLARSAAEPADAEPPRWALSFLQNLARYVYDSHNWFEPGHHIDLNGPIAADRDDTEVRAAAFTLDPELGEADTPHGRLEFLQVVGLTSDEYEAALRWSTAALLDVLAGKLPLLVTDINRASLLRDDDVAAAIRTGIERDGSTTDSLFVPLAQAAVDDSGTTVLTFGAHSIRRILAVLTARRPFNRGLYVQGDDDAIAFTPANEFTTDLVEHVATVALPPGAAEQLAATVQPVAGDYRVPSLPGLVIRVKRSDITDGHGNVVNTIG